MAPKPASLWHLAQGGKTIGTFTSQQLADMGKAGRITSDMTVWRDGIASWQPVSKVKGLNVIAVPGTPPPSPAPPSITVAVVPAADASPTTVRGHVTIEKTGKSLKLQQLLSFLFIVVGFFILTIAISTRKPDAREVGTAASVGSSMFAIGLVWRVLTRIRIWWHHG